MNTSLCVICQTEKEEESLVENPRSIDILLNTVNARAGYGETKYVEIANNLKELSKQD